MNEAIEPTVPKSELLERERRWSRPAGIAALLGVALAVGSVALQQSAVGADNDTDAERLINIHENASDFFLSNVMQGLAFLLFAAPLWFLFKAAQGRSPLVRTAFGVLAVVGPVLLLASQVISAVGFTDVADQYNEERPGLEREDRQQAQQEDAAPSGGAQDGTTQAGTQSEPTETTGSEQSQTGATETTSDDEDSDEDKPSEDRAEDLVSDNGAVTAGGFLSLPGFLGFVVGMVYVPLWAMRTGLLTRFWGSLGMAIGVVVVIIPPAQLALMLWMAAIGLMLVGLWPRGRPPAWEAGVALPWPKPGEPAPSPPPAPGEPVEGSGREVSEPPLPEPTNGDPSGEAPGPPRKKRKRRD